MNHFHDSFSPSHGPRKCYCLRLPSNQPLDVLVCSCSFWQSIFVSYINWKPNIKLINSFNWNRQCTLLQIYCKITITIVKYWWRVFVSSWNFVPTKIIAIKSAQHCNCVIWFIVRMGKLENFCNMYQLNKNVINRIQ